MPIETKPTTWLLIFMLRRGWFLQRFSHFLRATKTKNFQHKSFGILFSLSSTLPISLSPFRTSFNAYWFKRVKNNYDKTISRSRHTKVANLSGTSASQSIYSDACRQTPFLCQNPITLIYLFPRTLFPPKKKRIFIRFSLLCSFLIKASSADSITCFFRRILVLKTS